MNTFSSARVKLTVWYTLVLAVISIGLSSLYYLRTLQIIEIQYHQLNRRLSGQPGQMKVPRQSSQEWTLPENHQEILSSEFNSIRSELFQKILTINLLIIIAGAGGSLILSGKTLHPIKLALDKQKQFVTDAAHELKTPLTALQTSIEVNLMDKKINQDTKRVLKENLEDVAQLNSLTTRLLQLSHAEENGLPRNRKAVDLLVISELALKKMRPVASKKNIKLKIDTGKCKNINVLGDEESLLEVIIILLDNAIKYSKKNSDIILKTSRQKNTRMIEVSDHGVGIAKKDIDKIFDRFYQSDTSRHKNSDKQTGGYGLGLALAKQIIENHGGKIDADSQLGKGSVFRIKFVNNVNDYK